MVTRTHLPFARSDEKSTPSRPGGTSNVTTCIQGRINTYRTVIVRVASARDCSSFASSPPDSVLTSSPSTARTSAASGSLPARGLSACTLVTRTHLPFARSDEKSTPSRPGGTSNVTTCIQGRISAPTVKDGARGA